MSSESSSIGSVDDQTELSAALALQETNSVNSSTGESDEPDERVYERVLEFEREYPELANLPLSTQHGRKLRRIVTEAKWTDEWVEPDEPTERAFTVTELERRSAATWGEAVSCFLSAHVDYEGLTGIFSNQDGETIEVPVSDAWVRNTTRSSTHTRRRFSARLVAASARLGVNQFRNGKIR